MLHFASFTSSRKWKRKKILKLETIETTDILKNPSLKEISKVSHFTYDRKQTFSCGEKKTDKTFYSNDGPFTILIVCFCIMS